MKTNLAVSTTLCAGLVMLLSSSTRAQNLFVADFGSHIYEFTPGGVRSTFASGLSQANSLAFNSAGNLFVSDSGSGNIYEYTPGGVQSTFASGLTLPNAIAFDSAGNLFVAADGPGYSTGYIFEFTPGGVQSTFASGLSQANSLAFNSAGNLFVSNGGSGNIYEYTPNGTRSTFASGLNNSVGLAFQPVTTATTCPSIIGTWSGQLNVAASSAGYRQTTISLQVTDQSTNGCLLRGYLHTGSASRRMPWSCFNAGSLWGKVPFTGTILDATGVILNFGIFGQGSASLDMSQTPPVMKKFIFLSTGGAANVDTAVGDLTEETPGP